MTHSFPTRRASELRISDAAYGVRLHGRIDVVADFPPVAVGKVADRLLPGIGPAADMQKCFAQDSSLWSDRQISRLRRPVTEARPDGGWSEGRAQPRLRLTMATTERITGDRKSTRPNSRH